MKYFAMFIVIIVGSEVETSGSMYYSRIGGKRILITTTRDHFKNIGPFIVGKTDLPFSYIDASKLAIIAVQKLVPIGRNRLDFVSLSRDDSLKDRWVFLIGFSNDKTGDTVQIVVMFDKTVLVPK